MKLAKGALTNLFGWS